MASDAAQLQMEVERRMRDIGARFGKLPDAADELLRLIEETDTWLSRVDQSPPESMYSTLRPTMSALIKKELLDHTDSDVKLAVISCLTEVTRITAPEAPYDDDVMRDVFTRVVDAFGKLDDTKSPTFARRVSVLETVAKVRSCVLMLDLDCDDLIRDTFHHFFRTISPTHQENVISSMETIMMFVIEESEPVHPDLASCLLQNVKKGKKESLPQSFGLAEKVIGLCSKKLKPVFIQLLQGTPLNEYSEVVTSLLQDSSDVGGDNNIDTFGKDTESSKLEQDVNCPGQDGTPPNGTPTTALTNGGAPVDNVKSPNRQASSEQKPQLPSDDKQAKVSDELISGDKEVPELVNTEPEKPSDLNSNKSDKLDSSTESEVTEHSKVVNDGGNKLPSESCNRAADDTSKTVDSTPVVVKSKRGRPPAAKSQEKKPVGKSQGSGLESNKVGLVSNSGGRATRRLAKDYIKSSSRQTGEGESSNKQQKASLKLQKEDTLSDEDTDANLSLKEIVSPKSLTKMGKTKGQPGYSGGSKRKHVQEAEEAPQSKKNKALDGSLVGSRIKVWWSDDKKFYDGVVKSFDASSKKHKIVHDDGYVEKLLLKDEKWEFIVEEKSNNPDTASDMGMNPRPPGGFTNFIQSQQFPPFPRQPHPENFHFVGVPAHYAPFSPPPAQGSPSMAMPDSGTPRSVPQQSAQDCIDLDNEGDAEPARTDRRLAWTHEEDIRLVSAWLSSSNDSINRNCKKTDHYWSQVVAVYNSTTSSNRRREVNQLKIRWHQISTQINHFNGCWMSLKAVYASGMSDDQLTDNTLVKYENKYSKPFTFTHSWRALRDQPKWHAYCEMLNKEKNSSSLENVVDVKDLPRPEGNKAAKANRNGKRKVLEPIAVMGEELDKFIEAQSAAREDRNGMIDFQQRISSEKLEAAKLAHLTAKEKKECKMIDTYKELLLADTTGLNDDAKAERAMALKCMRLRLFGTDN